MPSPQLSAAPLLALALLLGGCAGKKLSEEESCKARWEKLHAKFEKKRYNEIRDQYGDLLTSCSGYEFTEQAAFELGEIQYNLGDWLEAESEFAGFLKDYPASRRFGETASYRLAMASAKQVGIPQRDQSKTVEALARLEQFLDEYPDSKRADTARQEVENLTNKLVAKQLQIARLYERMDEPQAAAIYYKNILKDYSGRVDLRDINLKLALCYVELRQFDEAETYLAKFDGLAKDDPFKERVRKAYQSLEKAKSELAREKKEEQQEMGRRQETL
jgi:outer membrane assembly lipoprotein YfiO